MGRGAITYSVSWAFPGMAPLQKEVPLEVHEHMITVWVKNRYPKWGPCKWENGPKPAVPWWFDFDPYPLHVESRPVLLCGRRRQSEDVTAH